MADIVRVTRSQVADTFLGGREKTYILYGRLHCYVIGISKDVAAALHKVGKPRDGDELYSDEAYCSAHKDVWVCTRPLGHSGGHVACNTSRAVAVWPRSDEEEEKKWVRERKKKFRNRFISEVLGEER